ncbi:carboxymuconolactone decarboxylase family protein [Hyphococcus sp.]|uniref:carboxymuconolactone decarboxylase family protein n=1 Tax=Hyphococcus sp. TaxID=2038636 RepID=UPI0020814473|nr:MAG: alkyl hydroperoxide reductase AhpD [Marinicaulis sp.]
MKAKLNYMTAAPDGFQAMMAISDYVQESGLEHSLLELVKIRASQINGCAFCLDMHIRDARAAGETEARIYLLPAWRETAVYSPREQAALAWTEALTQLSTDAAERVYDEVRAQFDDHEMAKLAIAIGVINIWNRLNVAFGVQPVIKKAAA